MVNQTLPDRGIWGTGYNTYDDVEARLRARRSSRGRRGDAVSFGLVGRLLLTLPLLAVVAALLFLGLRMHITAAFGVLALFSGFMAWYWRDLWRPRR